MANYPFTSVTSDENLDKIVYEDEVTYTVPGPASISDPTYQLETIPNPYGQKCFVAASYSVDGVNFYDQSMFIYYFFNSFNPQVLSFSVDVGCSDSTIYFFLTNGLEVGGSPVSQTVTIRFAIHTLT